MTNLVLRSSFQDTMQEAQALILSGFLPRSITKPEQAVAIITMGRELGLGTWAALNGINVIQGKPTISPQLMLGLINRSGQIENMAIQGDSQSCNVTMKRLGRDPHTETFTIQDAAKMGLADKDNWKKQPAVMLKWRCVAACCRVVFPDIIIGFYSPEEINPDVAIDYDTGEVVSGDAPDEIADQLPPTTPTTQPPLDNAPSRKAKGEREPMGPEDLAAYIFAMVEKQIARIESAAGDAYELISADAAQKLAIQWKNITGLSDDKRHAVSEALFHAASTKDYTIAMADVCRAWLTKHPAIARAEAQLVAGWLDANSQ